MALKVAQKLCCGGVEAMDKGQENLTPIRTQGEAISSLRAIREVSETMITTIQNTAESNLNGSCRVLHIVRPYISVALFAGRSSSCLLQLLWNQQQRRLIRKQKTMKQNTCMPAASRSGHQCLRLQDGPVRLCTSRLLGNWQGAGSTAPPVKVVKDVRK